MLLGDDAMKHIGEARIIIFGIGGVGSWCAECLVRTGAMHLTMVDGDSVCPSNINRQLPATTSTVGQKKVDVMRRRLLDISPEAEINAVCNMFSAGNAARFHLENYDCIIDAIDSLADKQLLIETACRTQAFFVSSMGAALKADPTRIQVAEFSKVHGCPLARALRHNLRKAHSWPTRDFTCVFSDELLSNKSLAPDGATPLTEANSRTKKCPNGSLMQVTAVAGITLASIVIRHLADL